MRDHKSQAVTADARPTKDGHVEMPFGAFPPPDIVDFLVGQHMQIRDLAGQVLRTSGTERRDAFRQLVHLLAVHETAEEEVVHPVARRALDSGSAVVDARLAEEHRAKELLKQLEKMDTDDPSFVPLFEELRSAVISHALYEQRYEFNRLRQHLPTAVRGTMRVVAQAAEKTAPTHPHPGVESATANLLIGPAAAVVDRARDAIRAARPQDRD